MKIAITFIIAVTLNIIISIHCITVCNHRGMSWCENFQTEEKEKSCIFKITTLIFKIIFFFFEIAVVIFNIEAVIFENNNC